MKMSLENLPEELGEVINKIENNADEIYVREEINGKWGSYSLTELPAKLAIKHALRFIKRRISLYKKE